MVLALTAAFLAPEARAGGLGHSMGGFSGGSHPSSNFVSRTPSTGSLNKSNFATVQNFHQGSLTTPNKLGQVSKLNTSGGKNLTSKLNVNKGLASNLNKNSIKFDFGKGMKTKNFLGKYWCGYCGFGCGGWCGWGCCWSDWYCGGWWPDCCCYRPWYYTPCYNVCCEYYASDYPTCFAESTVPAVKIAHVINPAGTQTALGFAVNGQTYSLDAGKTQDVELNGNTVIEFDRGSGNDTGRYTLSEGAYQFASTPQGWELYRAGDASLAGDVAAN